MRKNTRNGIAKHRSWPQNEHGENKIVGHLACAITANIKMKGLTPLLNHHRNHKRSRDAIVELRCPVSFGEIDLGVDAISKTGHRRCKQNLAAYDNKGRTKYHVNHVKTTPMKKHELQKKSHAHIWHCLENLPTRYRIVTSADHPFHRTLTDPAARGFNIH